MGIRPNGSSAAQPVAPDNPESRYSDWLTDLEDSGEIVGGVWQETDAKASSGNSGVTDLAGRVAALEAADLSGLPLLLWWDGTGSKPQLKQGWGLFNALTGEFEKGT